jgi:hypothetical protein
MASGADKLRHAPTGRQSGLSGPLGRHFTAIDRVLIVCEGSASAAQAANLAYKAVWQLFDSVGDELIENLWVGRPLHASSTGEPRKSPARRAGRAAQCSQILNLAVAPEDRTNLGVSCDRIKLVVRVPWLALVVQGQPICSRRRRSLREPLLPFANVGYGQSRRTGLRAVMPLLGQVHLPQKCAVARIVLDTLEQWIALEVIQL